MSNSYIKIVNKQNKYNEKYFKSFNMILIESVDNKKIKIEKKTYKHFLSLQKEVKKKEDIIIGIKYAYRSVKEQSDLHQKYLKKYGKHYTAKVVAIPQTSEHHSGLAIDIEVKIDNKWISNNDNLELVRPILEKVHKYLAKNGFILRYPKNKSKETGYNYEPWHFRYVGKKYAKHIVENGLILEDLYKQG